jgi:hypothetical protein
MNVQVLLLDVHELGRLSRRDDNDGSTAGRRSGDAKVAGADLHTELSFCFLSLLTSKFAAFSPHWALKQNLQATTVTPGQQAGTGPLLRRACRGGAAAGPCHACRGEPPPIRHGMTFGQQWSATRLVRQLACNQVAGESVCWRRARISARWQQALAAVVAPGGARIFKVCDAHIFRPHPAALSFLFCCRGGNMAGIGSDFSQVLNLTLKDVEEQLGATEAQASCRPLLAPAGVLLAGHCQSSLR